VTPTQRTLARCRAQGWPVQVVERYIPQARRRVDLFGAIDLVALDGLPGVLGIQACSGGDAATRMAKARALPEIAAWVGAGNRFEVWAWRKVGPRGKRKLWEVRIVPFDGGDQ
jgi:hypothetical protein